ncbi:MAG: RsmB/NOP family class I SAM-dependent RNA methyltransferase [Beijerinckiaceae bacterium]
MTKPASAKPTQAPKRNDGLMARRFAAEVIEDVVKRRQALDERLDRLNDVKAYADMSASDRGLTRAISTAALRRYGTIRKALADRLAEGIPVKSGRLESYLIAGVAQILDLQTPPHAAVNTTVSLVREDKHGRHFADLANAVLRRIAEARTGLVSDPAMVFADTPDWLRDRWTSAYGEEAAKAIAGAHRHEASIDITVKSDAAGWAQKLEAELLPTGSLRLTNRTAVPGLAGFEDGAWWVQDASAALPARLINAQPHMRVLDLCAAPGGKTAQLASTGAAVTALDRSAPRMERLASNMQRLGLTVDIKVAEATAFKAEPYDAILLDAPCSATGTIRRHPDVAWSKTLEDIYKLAALQAKLLDHAATLLKPGGILVYATCSLERDEGEKQIERFLARNPAFTRKPVQAHEVGDQTDFITTEGDLRCLPSHLPHAVDRMSGMDGFFASRLVYTPQ